MKQRFLLLLISSLMLSSNSQATITCSKPKLSKPSARDSIYHFKITETCELPNETIDLKNLKDAYLSDIVKKDSQFKVHKQQNYTQKDLAGYALDVTQSYNSPNGAVSVNAKVIIVDDQTKKFYYEMRSKSMLADGDANLEKSMLNTATLEILPAQNKLTITKEIDVEKPWYAPDSVFLDRVEASLKESIRKSALANARKIIGQKIDALHK